MPEYDVIIIGAGHAGIEAALAASRMGCRTLLLTIDKRSIGRMSCNPAIGGVGKGQLVKEIDALGGEMGRAADACGIQFRILNASKGPAVQSSRAQIDMRLYEDYMRAIVEAEPKLCVKEAQVVSLRVERGVATGVITTTGEEIAANCVVVAPGTFLDGVIHVGLTHKSGGRINEPASIGLADNLKSLGFSLLRFKTGTCPRLDKNSIDFSNLTPQYGDEPPKPFSFSIPEISRPQVPCYITYTNPETHQIILDNLDRSPLYAGVIKATGVRYCPSIEDKIVKFKDRSHHQIFLEPQGLDSDEIYPNGISTSLPEDVQLKLIHSIQGLEHAKVNRYGYGIEHTVVEPTELFPALEAKRLRNLFFAGQINGTTGYEEAGAQGLVAGINAGLRVQGKDPLVLERSSSYIGVLIDDLTTKGTPEPYRMFTSRVEYRLIIREDNADLRLGKIGHEIGLVSEKDFRLIEDKRREIEEGMRYLAATRVKPGKEINEYLVSIKSAKLTKSATLEDILRRPHVTMEALVRRSLFPLHLSKSALQQVEIEVKYEGFIRRQRKDVERFEHLEKIKLPESLDFSSMNGISREIREKLARFKPLNLGQASRISGVTPAAISLLMVYLKKRDRQN